MAIDVRTVWECQQNATSANTNGGGFNPASAGFMTDLATTGSTGQSASVTVSSATYSFVATDVGAWIYIKSGTSWTPGWYKITAVNAGTGVATVNGTIGQAIQPTWDSSFLSTSGYPSPKFLASTVQGIGTANDLTGGTFGIDYSQQTTANLVVTDLVIGATTSQVTSVLTPFGPNHAGNIMHILTQATGTVTVGWYEIQSVATNIAQLDRSAGVAASTGTAKVGGAISLGSSTANQTDDIFFEAGLATNGTGSMRYFIKASSSAYVIQQISIATTGGTQAPIVIEGYGTLRGDAPTGTNRPIFGGGANSITLGANWDIYNLIIYTSASNGLGCGTASKPFNCKSVNVSTSVRNAINGSTDVAIINCEAVSYRGIGINTGSFIFGNYIHDSDIGIVLPSGASINTTSNNIIENAGTSGITDTTAQTGRGVIINNTIYGQETPVTSSVGIKFITAGTDHIVMNNIIAGWVTGIQHADVQTVGYDDYNDYFNNTTDVADNTKWQRGVHDLALNPNFTSAVQRTGATATTTAGNHLVQTGATFQTWGITSATNGIPNYFVYISGTGVTSGFYGILTVDSETQITTDIALAANATGDKVWRIGTGHNFSIGTNLKAQGTPGNFQGLGPTSYVDIGAVQRQESLSGSTGFFIQ